MTEVELIYEQAYQKYDEEIYNRTFGQLIDEFGDKAFQEKWAVLTLMLPPHIVVKSGSRDVALWEFTEGICYYDFKDWQHLKYWVLKEYLQPNEVNFNGYDEWLTQEEWMDMFAFNKFFHPKYLIHSDAPKEGELEEDTHHLEFLPEKIEEWLAKRTKTIMDMRNHCPECRLIKVKYGLD